MHVCFHNTFSVVFLQCNMSKIGAATQKPSMNHNASQHGSSASNFKEIHIDEEVKIAVTLAFERFQYSDQKGISCFYWSI